MLLKVRVLHCKQGLKRWPDIYSGRTSVWACLYSQVPNLLAIQSSAQDLTNRHMRAQGGGPFELYSTDMEGIFRQALISMPCRALL